MQGRRLAIIKVLVFCACFAPLVWLVVRMFGVGGTSLGAHPVQEILHTLGETSLQLLLITLAVTPARILTGWNWLVRLRRMLGLWAFAYAVLHLLTYIGLDLRFAFGTLFEDIAMRPYITVGMTALVLMVPLAITSTNKMQRRLGRRWVKLHRLIYPIAVLAVVHFYWLVKADTSEPLLYAAILAVLLGFRVQRAWQRRRAAVRRPVEPLRPAVDQ